VPTWVIVSAAEALFAVIAQPDFSILSLFRFVKLASTSTLVKGAPLPARVTIVVIDCSPGNLYGCSIRKP